MTKDIRSALEAGLQLPMDHPVLVDENEHSYPIKEEIWDNWFPFAYRAFSLIATRRKIKSYASVGCGSGADALGAYYAFPKLESIILTDIDERVLPLAQHNVTKYALGTKVIPLSGSLCTPLRDRDMHVDLIYENLPNIPEEGNVEQEYCLFSKFRIDGTLKKTIFDTYLLSSHAAFLEEAHAVLHPGGIALCSIGGRIPYPYYTLQQLIETSGYHCVQLVGGFKLQTEPEEVLPGYAQAEKEGVEFRFYRYDNIMARLRFYKLHCSKTSSFFYDERIDPERLTAQQALELYSQDNSYKIGHEVYMIAAIRK